MTNPTEQDTIATLKHVAESLSGGVFDDPIYASAADLIERLVKERLMQPLEVSHDL